MTAQSAGLELIASLARARLLGFANRLREFGVEVTPVEVIDAIEALGELDLSDPDGLYWALRACMVRRVEDIPQFDAAFRSYWGGEPRPAQRQGRPQVEGPERRQEAAGPDSAGAVDGGAAAPGRTEAGALDQVRDPIAEDLEHRGYYSEVEVLRRKDFAEYTDEDYTSLERLLRRARFGGPWRTSRRMRPRGRGRMDLRRTVQASVRTAGQPLRVHRRQAIQRMRRVTFFCDVSGSMDRYSRAVLELAAVAARQRGSVEAFAFATRVTRLTEELTTGGLRDGIAEAIGKTVDWSGGTRVGASLRTLNRDFPEAVRGAAVVVASDGWDLGDAHELASESAELQRTAHHLIWVNPHLQDPRFEPLTQGMAAALPFVDAFLTCHNFESFESLLDLLEIL